VGRLWLLSGVSLAVPLACLMTLELVFPRPDTQRLNWRSHGKAALFWAIYNLTSILIMAGLTPFLLMLNDKPVFAALEAHLPRPLAFVCEALLAVLIGDFIYYWYHRFQHRHLWRFHAVHHSLREMNGLNNYHHFTEPLMRTLLCGVPTGLLIGDPYAVPIVGSLIAFQGYYLHSTTRLNLGWLGRYVLDNRFHRIHHSIEPQHYDKNFAIFTSLWDRLFGTAWLPEAEEWPKTGITDFPEPATVVEYLWTPFVWRPQAEPVETASPEPLAAPEAGLG
jgi:sterol desaturase/sphingolipid hydroxylase (fatty acid hydroxylase superfamily)